MTDAEPVLIDTNLLVYAFEVDTDIEKHQKAISFLGEKITNNNTYLSVQNLAELYSVLTTKLKNPVNPNDIQPVLMELSKTNTLLQYSFETLCKAISINQQYKTHFWDALLAATMLENNIHTIYTEDTGDFSKIKGIKAINPFQTKH